MSFTRPLGGGALGNGALGVDRSLVGFARAYKPGTYVFRAPRSGTYVFAQHGAGADSSLNGANFDGGGSGAFTLTRVQMNAGQTADLVVGARNSGVATTVTVAGRPVISAGAAAGRTGGAAAGGDINLNGSDGGLGPSSGAGANGGGADGGTAGGGIGGSGGGAGAPGAAGFQGGDGAQPGGSRAQTPGGGGAADPTTNTGPGGDGRIAVYLERY